MNKTKAKEEITGTCRKDKCPMFRQYGRECPMLVTNSWLRPDGKTKQTEDCAPITGMQMQQDMHNRVVACQKTQEESKDQFTKLQERFDTLIKQSTIFMLENSKPPRRRINS